MSWQGRDCIGKDEGSNPGRCRPWRRVKHQKRSRLVSTHLVKAAGVRLNVVLAQLTHDGHSDLGVESDLVVELNTLEIPRDLDGVGSAENNSRILLDASTELRRTL